MICYGLCFGGYLLGILIISFPFLVVQTLTWREDHRWILFDHLVEAVPGLREKETPLRFFHTDSLVPDDDSLRYGKKEFWQVKILEWLDCSCNYRAPCVLLVFKNKYLLREKCSDAGPVLFLITGLPGWPSPNEYGYASNISSTDLGLGYLTIEIGRMIKHNSLYVVYQVKDQCFLARTWKTTMLIFLPWKILGVVFM